MTRLRILFTRALASGSVALALAVPALAQSALPDPNHTPGAINPAVTQANIGETICVRGWTRTVRAPESYTEPLKREQIREWGYSDRRPGDYEEDHLIPLELGGSPTDPRNLWPEPHRTPDGWGSRRKDYLENLLKRLVCAGRVPLNEARQAIAGNWIAAFQRFTATAAPNDATPSGQNRMFRRRFRRQ